MLAHTHTHTAEPLMDIQQLLNCIWYAASDVAWHPTPRVQVLKSIAAGEFVVLLDERGRELSSEGMAKLIGTAGACKLVRYRQNVTCYLVCVNYMQNDCPATKEQRPRSPLRQPF